MNIDKNIISVNIARYRIKARKSQKEISQITGLNPSYISELENKNNKLPSMDALTKIASALNITVDQLLVENLTCFKDDTKTHGIYNELPFVSEKKLKILLAFLRTYDESKLKLK